MEKRNFTEASAYCRDQNAHLADIESTRENMFVNFRLIPAILNRSFPMEDVWIGYSDIESEGTWISERTNITMKYENWLEGQPDQSNGNEDCVEIFYSGKDNWNIKGKWNDNSCNARRISICKKSKIHQL